MTWSPLRCPTSIIRSSALVQASSSLSVGLTRAWPRGTLHQEFYFRRFFARVSSIKLGFHHPRKKESLKTCQNLLLSQAKTHSIKLKQQQVKLERSRRSDHSWGLSTFWDYTKSALRGGVRQHTNKFFCDLLCELRLSRFVLVVLSR